MGNPGFAQRPHEVSQAIFVFSEEMDSLNFLFREKKIQKDTEKELREGTVGMTLPKQGDKEGFRPF